MFFGWQRKTEIVFDLAWMELEHLSLSLWEIQQGLLIVNKSIKIPAHMNIVQDEALPDPAKLLSLLLCWQTNLTWKVKQGFRPLIYHQAPQIYATKTVFCPTRINFATPKELPTVERHAQGSFSPLILVQYFAHILLFLTLWYQTKEMSFQQGSNVS